MAVTPILSTYTGGVLSIVKEYGLIKLSIVVSAGSVIFTGSGSSFIAGLSGNSVTIVSTDAVNTITFAGNGVIDTLSIDCTAGTIKFFGYTN